MEFGQLLQQYREEAGLSQNGLARLAGIDPTHLNRIERGKQGPPRGATVLKLVRAFEWTLSDERARRLLSKASSETRDSARRPAILGAPLTVRPRRLSPLLRELKLGLLRAIELVIEAEEAAAIERKRNA